MYDHNAYQEEREKERGWEEEYMPSTMADLLMIAGSYGIHPNDMKIKNYWSNDDTPREDWMTGDETYYQMWVKHIDGSDLSQDQRSEVNDALIG